MDQELTPALAKDRIRLGEDQKTEFKQSFGETREIIQTLVAFAHAKGGLVLVGVAGNGTVVGVHDAPEEFSNSVKRDTSPPLYPTIDVLEIDGKKLAAISVDALHSGVVHAYGKAFIRVGKTNQVMSPTELEKRLFAKFQAENLSEQPRRSPAASSVERESWNEREQRRVTTYEKNRGLFLAHTWRPSEDPEQEVDIVIYLRQHPGPDQPLADGHVKSVEYHLGPKFFKRTVVKVDPADNFRLEVSAYGPMLCMARVNFDDGHPPIDLERYVDF